ncbi:MAG TPA: hypothetical protein VI193_09225 [Acidimicrobiia bacterium]
MTETSDLARQLLELQEEFHWESKSAAYELVASWERERSGSVFHRLIGKPSGPEVVVKVSADWASEDALRTFEAMIDLADAIEAADIAGAAAIRPLAWSEAPPQLVMPFVDGADVVSILRQPDHPAWREDVATWMRSAGGMLSAFHARNVAAGSAEALAEVRALAERFRVRRNFDGVDWQGRTTGSFGDFGPGNLHAGADGVLYLLDPPLAAVSSPVHRDLGNFTFELRRQLDGRGYTASPPVTGHFDRLCDAFLQGYSDAWGSTLDETDLALIALFELRRAAGMARKRFPGRLGDALWFARSALARRREVIATPDHS